VACWRSISRGKYGMIPLEFIFREKKADDFERLAFLAF
jgi:hypothetical protein